MARNKTTNKSNELQLQIIADTFAYLIDGNGTTLMSFTLREGDYEQVLMVNSHMELSSLRNIDGRVSLWFDMADDDDEETFDEVES
jgi:hypothetical protein